VNIDGLVDLSDPLKTLGFLFVGEEPSPCSDAADANDDGEINVSDVIYTLNWLFLGDTAPPAPGPTDCGQDPTEDALSLCDYPQSLCE